MKLASVFTDHAVFQRRIPVPVWGTGAKPCSMLRAELAGKVTFTRAASDGSFFFRFTPFEAGGPYELSIRCEEDGSRLVRNDILIGEVWLAGGQSNMQYELGADWSSRQNLPESERENAVNRIQLREYLDTLCENGMIREFHVPMVSSGSRETDVDAVWRIVDRKTAPEVSAVAAWFARFVQEKIKVPVGLLVSNWGGTIAEAWTSRAGLLSNPGTARLPFGADSCMRDEEKWMRCSAMEEHGKLFEKYTHPDPGNQGFGWGWADPASDDGDWRTWEVPGDWVAQNISGHGVLWTRLHVFVPESWAGKELTLRIGRIDKMDTTYFNGVEIGHTGTGVWDETSWNLPRAYTVPAELVRPGDNVIAVRMFSFIYGASMHGNTSEFSLSAAGTEESLPLAGQWKAKAEADFGVIRIPSCHWSASNPNSPSILFDAMLRPLIPYAIRGAIWYQGESNAETVSRAAAYRETLDAMIRDWRYHWEEGDFPFIQVELANYRTPASYDPKSAWPLLRESQSACCRDLPNVYLASAIDIGEAEDIHPQNKKDVGFRLALAALYHVYHAPGATLPEGPRFLDAEREGKNIRIRFRYGAGLHFKGEPRGFYVSDGSGEFLPADHVGTDGDSVLVSSDAVETPFHVRYSWSDNPDGNLYNAAGLPAASFRTDSLPL